MPSTAPHLDETKIKRLVLATLLVIIALGTVLRIAEIGSESLWLDEATSVKFSQETPARLIEETSKDVHPPLYYLTLHYWMRLFGDSEAAVRLLSALLGILAIPVTYKLAARMFDRSTGLLAAALLAVSRFHLDFSQEARMYSLLCLTGLLSIYFFFRLLEDRSRLAFLGYIVTTGLMMYTHVYSFFILAAENVYFFTLLFASRSVFKSTWKRWLVAQAVLVILFLPWLSVQAQQFSRVQEGFWIPKLPPRLLLYTLTVYAGSNQLAWILAPLILVAVFSGWNGWKGDTVSNSTVIGGRETLIEGRLKLYLLLLWLTFPILLPYIVSQFSSPIFLPKYTIAALPAFTIIAARGLLSLRFHQLRIVALLLLICFSFFTLRNYFSSLKKDLWREAVAGFQSLAKPHDLVLFNDQSGRFPFQYYSKRSDLELKPFPDFQLVLTTENLSDALLSTVKDHQRVWLVVSHPGTLTPLIPKLLAQWYDDSARITYPGVEMYLFEKRK